MIIENPDAFKTWLTSILEPLCDADPAALAKYVYALVKKDKPLEELRDGMLDQLDVFLQLETKPFVDMLFESLETLDYLTAYESQPAAEPAAPEPAREPEAEVHAAPGAESSSAEPAPAPAPAAAVAPAPAPAPSEEAAPRHRVVVPRAPARPAPPPQPPAPTPTLARAPPLEQTLVKRVPLTELLEEIVEQPPRRRDRRDLIREREERRRGRSRSWERRARPRRHDHAPPDARRHDKRRAASRSPSPRGRYRNRSPPAAPAALDRPPTRSRSRSPLGAGAPRERERARAPRDLERERERERMSRDRDHADRATRSRDRERSRSRSPALSRSASPEPRPDAYKRRCRDFDEKGYCMRGDLCQWDHGKDPVVLEDPSLSRVLALPVPEYNPATPDIWAPPLGTFPGALPYPHPAHAHPHPAHPAHAHLPPGAHPPHLPPGAHPAHPVHPAHLAPPPPLPPQHPLALAPHPPRELISVPRARDMPPVPASTPAAAPGMPPPRHPGPHKKGFDYNRLGAGRGGGGGTAGNCSLEVKKIPRGLNDITHLNNHFNKFGKIVNIKVYYDGDPEAALITFSNHTEANIAYKSTEAVLNNRFIKVFWHNAENKQEGGAAGAGAGGGGQAAPKPAPAGGKHASQNKVLINHDNIKATADTKQQLQQQQQQLADKEKAKSEGSNGQPAEPGAPGPGAGAAVGAAGVPGVGAAGVPGAAGGKHAQELSGMCQRAQALLNSELERQAVRIDLLESGNLNESQKEELSQVIKLAQKGVEKLNNQLRSYQKKMMQMQAAKKPKTKEEAEKEILDAELDMFTKQQEGQDVTEQIKKIAALRRQMALQFPAHPAARRPHAKSARYNPATRYSRAGAGAGGAGGGVGGAPKFVNQSVDHRPRALRISGFEPDELDALVAHFSQFGEVTGKEVEPAVPELVLQYRARAHAELALQRGKHYSDRTLSITWAANGKPMSGAAPPPAAPTPAAAAPAPAPAPASASASHHNGDAPAPAADAEAPQQSPQQGSALHFDEEDDEEAEDRSWRR